MYNSKFTGTKDSVSKRIGKTKGEKPRDLQCVSLAGEKLATHLVVAGGGLLWR